MTTTRGDTADAAGQGPPVVITEEDIVFNCPACHGELVVDRRGAGMTCPCSHCGHSVVVPEYRPPVPIAVQPVPNAPAPVPAFASTPAPSAQDGVEAPARRVFDFSGHSAEQLARRLDELKHQLKENQSQDTEMRGHVNRATMELHRLQLKLKKLQERQADIEAEMAAIRSHVTPSA